MIFVSLFILIIIYYISINELNQFVNKIPQEKYIELKTEFGKPDHIINKKNGYAVWNKRGHIEKLILKDELIIHKFPTSHFDFLYATIKIYIPDDILYEVLELNNTLYYDKLNHELTCRCNCMESIISTFYLTTHIIKNPENSEYYRSIYSSTINSTKKDKEEYNRLNDGLKLYITENQDYYNI